MSGYALIYDKSGVDSTCLSSIYEQIKNIIDDRSYRIERLSQAPYALNDTFSNPVRLFIIPGGSYLLMERELKPLAPIIRKLVIDDGASYLGLCAGAIAAACRPLLMYDTQLVPHCLNPPTQEITETIALRERMHLKLYSGHCCLFEVLGSRNYGTQLVRQVSSEAEQKPYHLYFQNGVFFPGASKELEARPLLEYDSYKFSGSYISQGGAKELYENIAPTAAVTQKVGKGRILLSGVHPEIGPNHVRNFSAKNAVEEEAKFSTLYSLSSSEAAQIDTMRDYLNTLSIATKKV